VAHLATRRIDFSDLNFGYRCDIGLPDCLSLDSGIGFWFNFDFFLFDVHERIDDIIVFAFCMYFTEHFSLVSFCRIDCWFWIGFFFDRILSFAELKLRVFFYGFMSRDQFHKLLFELYRLLTYFGLYFDLLFITADEDLLLFAVRPFPFLLAKHVLYFVIVNQIFLFLLNTFFRWLILAFFFRLFFHSLFKRRDLL
jgi:hypothetical protein